MTDTQLHRMLRASAETIPTGAPPVAEIARLARRRRARRTGVIAAAVLVVGGVGATTATALDLGAGEGRAPAALGAPYDMRPDDVPMSYLPTSGWSPGEHPHEPPESELRGELRLVDESCLEVREEGKDGVRVVWPDDWVGLVHADGSATLVDQDGRVAARTGDVLFLQGSWSGPASWSGELCLPDPGMAFAVTEVPEVVD